MNFAEIINDLGKQLKLLLLWAFLVLMLSTVTVTAGDLEDVMKSGTLRHLGIPYANFVTRNHDGLDVKLMQAFAKHLGVEYQFVDSTWGDIIPDLTGKKVKPMGNDIKIIGESPVRGDVIATGFTVLPWREKIVDFSEQTFPSGIWLIARGDAALTPILPTGSVANDINKVKQNLSGISVLVLEGSCLAPDLYGIKATGARVQYFPPGRDLEEMIPSVMAKMADTTLMDVPVALIALAKWPGKIKVIGPLSAPQDMACAFSKNSPNLKQAFDAFFDNFKKTGRYQELVENYYPSVFIYYPEFLSEYEN